MNWVKEGLRKFLLLRHSRENTAHVVMGMCRTLIRGNVHMKPESCLEMAHTFLSGSVDHICCQSSSVCGENCGRPRRGPEWVQDVVPSPCFPKAGR